MYSPASWKTKKSEFLVFLTESEISDLQDRPRARLRLPHASRLPDPLLDLDRSQSLILHSEIVQLAACCRALLLYSCTGWLALCSPGLRQFSRVGYLVFSELTGFAGWWVGDSVSSRFARMQVSDFAVGGGWWVQDHGWLAAGWLAGWMHLRARMRACIHPAQPRMYYL